MKEENEKVGLKLNIQKTKIMASNPITLWPIDGKTVETVVDFIFLGSNITADVDCSHEIKAHLHLGRKVVTNLESILKSRDVTMSTNIHVVKVMVFPVAMYRCEREMKLSLSTWRKIHCFISDKQCDHSQLRNLLHFKFLPCKRG